MVLKTHTNIKGLDGPSQLTRLKLKIRITTPIISKVRMCFRTKALIVDMDSLAKKRLAKYNRPSRFKSPRLSWFRRIA